MRVCHAHEGDCFLLLYGTAAKPRALLCDGGPAKTFDPHLKATLEKTGVAKLDAVILSHVDNDHVLGLLDLFADIRDRRAANEAEIVEIADLWINEFDQTIDGGGDIRSRLAGVI